MSAVKFLKNPGLWAFVLITTIALLALRLLEQTGAMQGLHERLGWAAPLVTLPLHVVVSISPAPSEVVCAFNGVYYGVWWGMLWSWLGWWLAGIVSFWIGRQLGGDFARRSMSERLKHFRGWPVDHPVVLIGLRQAPGIGGHLTTYGAGAIGVPWRRHLWCSAVAILPGAVLWAMVGDFATD